MLASAKSTMDRCGTSRTAGGTARSCLAQTEPDKGRNDMSALRDWAGICTSAAAPPPLDHLGGVAETVDLSQNVLYHGLPVGESVEGLGLRGAARAEEMRPAPQLGWVDHEAQRA